MSFVTPRNPAYLRVKRIKQGAFRVDPVYDAFIAGFRLWCIQRFAGPPIVFVHTDEQARTVKASALPVTWADTYCEIAKRHDEFGYLTRSEIAIQVDSKENFEANYSGHWYYYFK